MALVYAAEEFESKRDGCPYDNVTLAHAFKTLCGKKEPEEVKHEEPAQQAQEARVPASQPSVCMS